jgi:hypothetical protein
MHYLDEPIVEVESSLADHIIVRDHIRIPELRVEPRHFGHLHWQLDRELEPPVPASLASVAAPVCVGVLRVHAFHEKLAEGEEHK